jgi:GTPase SAR1 family protein
VSGTDGSAAAQAANQMGVATAAAVVSEKTFVFVGDKQSGKSSLIAKLLDEPTKDDVRETTALDFRFGTRLRDEKKQKINIYELGGGRTLSQLLHAPINAFSVASGTLVICIVLDLANPGASIDTLLFWLASLREELTKAAQEISQKLSPA